MSEYERGNPKQYLYVEHWSCPCQETNSNSDAKMYSCYSYKGKKLIILTLHPCLLSEAKAFSNFLIS